MMSTKFVILPAGGLPPARTLITIFVLSLFSGLRYVICLYHIYTYIYIYICKDVFVYYVMFLENMRLVYAKPIFCIKA